MNHDLTEGKPSETLVKFCLPLFGSVIFQQLYTIADSLVVGKVEGDNALAAVGNGYEITLIFLAFAFGCNVGGSVVISRLFGGKDYAGLKTAASTLCISGGVLSFVLLLAGFLFNPALLSLINTPEATFADSLLYLKIYTAGLPFLFFYNISTGIFTALGDSRTPFVFLAISSLANIGADVLFVSSFHLGVAGVAWATFICQGVSCILSVIFVLKRLSSIKTTVKIQLFSAEIFRKIAYIAIPTILQQSFISVGNIIIQSIVNSFGPVVMAGYSAGIKLNNLIITSLTTVGNGVTTYTAQNLGAGKLHRVRQGFRPAVLIAWGVAAVAFCSFFFGGSFFVGLFAKNANGSAVAVGTELLRIIAPFYFIVSLKLVSDGVLKGLGSMKLFMVATFSDLILRVVLALILSRSFGSTGIWFAWPVGWTTGTILSVVFTIRETRRNVKTV